MMGVFHKNKRMTVAELIAELSLCDPNALIKIWNMDERTWGDNIFLDACEVVLGEREVRLGSHVYDIDERREKGL